MYDVDQGAPPRGTDATPLDVTPLDVTPLAVTRAGTARGGPGVAGVGAGEDGHVPLEEYRAKRDPARTPEPVPADDPAGDRGGRSFVVQEHHATALHWDVRLERDGVLVSWAVPKGLPPDPVTKRLAKQTEDHPLDYGGFEGEIPAGEYGGGRVRIWDRGTYELEKWEDREVKVVLHGERVSGRYVFLHTGGKDGRDWLVRRLDPPATADWQPLPPALSPMLATPSAGLPTDPSAYAYELKWDGVRALAWVDGGRLTLRGRQGREITPSYPELRELAATLGTTQVVLDGEVVAFGAGGRPDFGRLQNRMHVARPTRTLLETVPVHYLLFDLLHLDGRSLLDASYDDRRAALEGLALGGPTWSTAPVWYDDGAAVLAASAAQGFEGVVVKRRSAPYAPGRRSPDWRKVKNTGRQEAVIGGWKPGESGRAGQIGSLLLGVQTDEGLTYIGNVGTGFTAATLRELQALLDPLRRDTSPFAAGTVPREQVRGAVWLEPTQVAEVEFAEWTKDGRLRHPSYKGLRDDKDPADVVRE